MEVSNQAGQMARILSVDVLYPDDNMLGKSSGRLCHDQRDRTKEQCRTCPISSSYQNLHWNRAGSRHH